MNCPKCSHENNHDAQTCSACGGDLSEEPIESSRPDVKTSELAVGACLCGVFSLVLFVPGGFLPPLLVLCGVSFAILALILGITALVSIERSYGRLTGRGFAAMGIIIPIAVFFLANAHVSQTRMRSVAYHLYCGTNLSGIGRAMLIYANDYEDELPRAGGRNAKWGITPNWQGATAAEAYGLSDGDGQASVSASFYLLVKYSEVRFECLFCRGDKAATEFTLAKYNIRNKELTDLWDFGPDPSKHCGYTYHLPYGEHTLTSSSHPDMAIAADRNPWLDTHARKARSVTDWARFDPNGIKESITRGNAFEHQDDGQNVLFVDSHTRFEKTSACGVDGDNIYTSQDGADIEKGVLPTMTSQPANKNDSLLVHDPPRGGGV